MGEVPISKEDEKEVPNPTKKRLKARIMAKKKKGTVREYNPDKDDACLIIGGYSAYIKKKDVVA
ncbi:MAG: hypothetical protein V3U20_03420 [Thermoplasmata archaeon]